MSAPDNQRDQAALKQKLEAAVGEAQSNGAAPERLVELWGEALSLADLLQPWPFAVLKRRALLGVAHLNRANARRACAGAGDAEATAALRDYEAAAGFLESEGMILELVRTHINEANAYLDLNTEHAENLERAIGANDAALALAERASMTAEIGKIHINRAIAYVDRVRGDKATNIEAALDDYAAALKVLSPSLHPEEWGAALLNRAMAWRHRVLGDRAENLEAGIEDCDRALETLTRAQFPADWAKIRLNRSILLLDRVKGDPSQNIETAIEECRAALDVFDSKTSSRLWIAAQINLGMAYRKRHLGERAENLEASIGCYDAALRICDRRALPEEWGRILNNRAVALLDRVRGVRSDNVEEAIRICDAALEVRTRRDAPIAWASTQLNRGIAYLERSRGRQRGNIEVAISAFDAALEVWTPADAPLDFALAAFNRANALSDRVAGDRSSNIEAALDGYAAALKAINRSDAPLLWASILLNQGAVLITRREGDHDQNVEAAISAYEAALEVRKLYASPFDVAAAELNLASAYAERRAGDRAENLDRAAAGYVRALDNFTLEAAPLEHLRAMRLLGGVRLMQAQWRDGLEINRSARSAADTLIGEGLDQAGMSQALYEVSAVGAQAAFAAAQMGALQTAFDELEAGRARGAALSLSFDSALAAATTELKTQIADARLRLRESERALNQALDHERGVRLEELIERRDALARLMQSLPNVVGEAPNAAVLLAQLCAKGVVVAAPLFVEQGAIVVLALPNGPGPRLEVATCPGADLLSLREMLRGDGAWLDAYEGGLADAAADQRALWLDAIAGVGARLGALFGHALSAALERFGVSKGASILMLPQGLLGLLPIGLATVAPNGEALGARYAMSIAPSLALACRDADDNGRLVAIVDPTNDLPFSRLEAAWTGAQFASGGVAALIGPEARINETVKGLRAASHWLLSCHGVFTWTDPDQSGLVLAEDEFLSIDALHKVACKPRLVAMSACESGLHDLRNAEEFVGLASAMLEIGAQGVVATLWPVEDFSSALLMARFYEEQIAKGAPPDRALWSAQAWLSRVEVRDLRALLRERAKISGDAAALRVIAARLSQAGPLEKPFAHPYHWAGFVLYGS